MASGWEPVAARLCVLTHPATLSGERHPGGLRPPPGTRPAPPREFRLERRGSLWEQKGLGLGSRLCVQPELVFQSPWEGRRAPQRGDESGKR